MFLSILGQGFARWMVAIAAMAASTLFMRQTFLATPDALIDSGKFLDDAFFYSVIAERIASGGPPSLDGIHETNGFQPLWMLLLVGLKGLVPGVEAFQLLTWAMLILLVVATGLLALWVMREVTVGTSAALAVTLGLTTLYAPFVDRVTNGLETALLVAMLAGWLLAARSATRSATRPAATAWAYLALTLTSCGLFLVRTDLFWAPMIGMLVIFMRTGVSIALFTNLAVSSALVLPYLAWNQLKFGALVPISGRVKSHYLETHLPTWRDYLGSNEWQGLPTLFHEQWGWAMVPMVIVAASLILWPKTARLLPTGLRLLAGLCLLHVLYLQIGHRELRPYTNYYFIPEALTVVLILGQGLRIAITARVAKVNVTGPWVGLAASVLVIGLGAVTALAPPQPNERWVARYELARAIDEIVPAGQPVGAFWPGLFAHVANRPVVPLDGIVSSPAYFETVILQERELDYAMEIGIEYVAMTVPQGFEFDKPLDKKRNWPDIHLERFAQAEHLGFETIVSLDFPPNGDAWSLVRISAAGGGGAE